jgi:hypothetical protein
VHLPGLGAAGDGEISKLAIAVQPVGRQVSRAWHSIRVENTHTSPKSSAALWLDRKRQIGSSLLVKRLEEFRFAASRSDVERWKNEKDLAPVE